MGLVRQGYPPQLLFFIGENDDDLDAFCGSFMSFASLSQIPSYV